MSDIQYQFAVDAIGIIRSSFTNPQETPIQSALTKAPGRVEVFSGYKDGLQHLEGFSHLILIYLFHSADSETLLEKPLVDGDEPHGIFSTRHFNRPNRIGLSVVRLMSIEGNSLFIEGTDILDGTPLLDIKPYIPAFDSVPEAETGWVSNEHICRIRERSMQW
jgi:tRNA-Thr(GGU) m(6)t(6)A37 methyltransferase TsaA